MILKKPSILLAACNSWHPLPLSTVQSSTSSKPIGTRQQLCLQDRQHGYATAVGDSEGPNERLERQEAEHIWPETPKGHTQLTPYQVLDTKTNATYTKAKYYQLVKLYHPDLKGAASHGISDTVKMERYRLIVAAHTILSDPVKRSAYDRFGAGWNGKAEVRGADIWRHGPSNDECGPFSQNWSDPSNPIWQNATWEDWERWRNARDGVRSERRTPVYMANSYFLALLIALAMIGSSLNYNRAQDAGHYVVEQRDMVHDRAAKELRRVRQDTSGFNSRHDRIEYFIRQREATLDSTDYDALQEERAGRVLKDREVCSSEEVRNGPG